MADHNLDAGAQLSFYTRLRDCWSRQSNEERPHASYLGMEQTVFDALCELYPHPSRRTSLRMVAMVSIGAMRLAMEAWRQEHAKRPLANYLRKQFDTLKEEI